MYIYKCEYAHTYIHIHAYGRGAVQGVGGETYKGRVGVRRGALRMYVYMYICIHVHAHIYKNI